MRVPQTCASRHCRQSSPAHLSPAITANSITIGSLAPLTGENAETGSAVKAVLTAYFDDLNQRGGIYRPADCASLC